MYHTALSITILYVNITAHHTLWNSTSFRQCCVRYIHLYSSVVCGIYSSVVRGIYNTVTLLCNCDDKFTIDFLCNSDNVLYCTVQLQTDER